MLPIVLLMKKHRVIERMIRLMGVQFERLEQGENLDLSIMDSPVDLVNHEHI